MLFLQIGSQKGFLCCLPELMYTVLNKKFFGKRVETLNMVLLGNIMVLREMQGQDYQLSLRLETKLVLSQISDLNKSSEM